MYSLFHQNIKTMKSLLLIIFLVFFFLLEMKASDAQTQKRKPATKIPVEQKAPPAQDKKAQEKSPSLKETLDFLTEKLNSNASVVEREKVGTGTKSLSQKIELVKFDGCTMTYQYTVKSDIENQVLMNMIQTITLSLSDIDSSKTEIAADQSHFELKLYPNTGKKIKSDVKMLILGKSRDIAGDTLEHATFPFDNQEMADRVSKAFAHALGLCKAKKEPF